MTFARAVLLLQSQSSLAPWQRGHFFVCTLLLFFLPLVCSPNTLAKPLSGERVVLRLGVGEDLPMHLPYQMIELERAFEAAGYALELVPLPAARSLIRAASGELDGDALHSLAAAHAYPSLMPVNEALFQAQVWVWVREKQACPSSPAQLQRLSTAFILGYSFLGRLEATRGSQTIQVNSVLAAMRMLQAGRIDYLLFAEAAMSSYREDKVFEFKACFTEPLVSIDFYSFLHRRHRHKIPAIEAGIRQARTELAESAR